MTVKELGMQYLSEEKILRGRIAILRKNLKTFTGNDLICLQERLQGLYFMARNCKQTGYYLINYYDCAGGGYGN
ncbi:MAG TPA: hypothetical protein DEQ02_02880 [Ruminococcaceae bacterium]|nr:hypothetical protein [Oscillospiraceae bacterium]